MRSLDTNVLVRYLTADEPRQTAAVDRLIAECQQNGEQLFVSILVLCELVWVLVRSYDQAKPEIIRALDGLLATALFKIEADSLVRRSLSAYQHGKGSFADYLVGEIGRDSGCRDTVTFDRGLRGESGFTLLV